MRRIGEVRKCVLGDEGTVGIVPLGNGTVGFTDEDLLEAAVHGASDMYTWVPSVIGSVFQRKT